MSFILTVLKTAKQVQQTTDHLCRDDLGYSTLDMSVNVL